MKEFHSNILHVEQAVLGCLLHDNTTWNEIGDFLQINDFSLLFHRDVYRVIQSLIVGGKKADIICVSQCVRNEKGENSDESFVKICDIAQGCYAPTNIKYYAEIVKQNSIDCNLIMAAQDIIVSVNEKKENRLDYAQKRISEICDQIPSEISSATNILKDVLSSIDERQKNQNFLTGTPTGFDELDKRTHGLHGGDLIILAGRPAMGKTLLAMNIAENVAIVERQSVAIFSLEMSKQQLIERSLISVAKINAESVKSGMLDDDGMTKLTGAIPCFHNAKLFVDDSSSISITEIRSKCRRIKREHGLALVIVDYITLMSGDGENETIRIGNISRGLKLIARDLNVPVIAISQLNRSVEQRNDRRPYMADLRQSGAIEQDADLIFFIYRDEVYNHNTHNKGMAEIIIAKHRNGSLGTVNLTFNSQCCRFDNYAGTYVATPQTTNVRKRQSYDY